MGKLIPFGLALAVMTSVPAINPAEAADLGGDCCADLEERVAELEATTVRKGNRKVSVTLSGHVNNGVLFWDDGEESNTYVVGNANDDLTMFRFEGDAQISRQWSAGYLIELEIANAASNSVDQENDNGDTGIGVSDVSMFVKSETLGQLTWGFTSQATDGASEVDLSGTVFAGYAAVDAVAGGFQLRSAGGLTGVTIDTFLGDFNGETFNVVRYDSPEIAGFTVAATWGEDDAWDVALYYAGEFGGFEVEAGIGYADFYDQNDGDTPYDNVLGSISILHVGTGLNFTFAAGERDYEGVTEEASFYYFKGGWKKNVNGLGDTALYGEYGHYDDFGVGVEDGVDGVDLACGGCTVSSSEAKIWGLGIVQYIDAAAMQLYIGYRHHEFEAGLSSGTVAFEDFDTVLAGGRIEF